MNNYDTWIDPPVLDDFLRRRTNRATLFFCRFRFCMIIWPSFRPIPWHTNAVAIWNSPNWAYGESQSWRPVGTQAYKVQPNRVVHHHVARPLQLHLGIARMAMIVFSVNLGIDFSKTNLFFGFATRNLLLHVSIFTVHFYDIYYIYLICIYLYYPMSFVDGFFGGKRFGALILSYTQFGTWRCYLGSSINYLPLFLLRNSCSPLWGLASFLPICYQCGCHDGTLTLEVWRGLIEFFECRTHTIPIWD